MNPSFLISARRGLGCASVLLPLLLLGACGSAPITPDAAHLHQANDSRTATDAATASDAGIPPALLLPPPPPAPQVTDTAERYTVVVRQVPVQELLQAVARDARVNIDIHPAVRGLVSLNAVDQTLRQILQRISRQTNARFRMEGPNLVVEPDTPYLRTYTVDYLNANRNSEAEIGASSQVSSLSAASTGTSAGGGGGGSSEKVNTTMQHHFWETLVQNLKDLLHEPTPPALPNAAPQRVIEASTAPPPGVGSAPGTSNAAPASAAAGGAGNVALGSNPAAAAATAAAAAAAATANGNAEAAQRVANDGVLVIANPETGVISVRATSRQHEHVQEFLDKVLGSARRQVLIEATVVEVTLNDNYNAGIDWSRLPTGGNFAFNVGAVGQTGSLGTIAAPNVPQGNGGLSVRYATGSVGAALNLLDTFGNTRVLSSPKLMALNNQTALLKVVDNLVYFNVSSQVVPGSNTSTAFAVTTATPRSVSVGLVMAVTPQISEAGAVSLIVRPTISRVLSYVTDPSTSQTANAVPNLVPQIQVREMESILSVQSGQIAVLGGLMQQTVDRKTTGVPGLGQVPTVGDLFNNRNDTTTKTELVIFLRPVVVDRQNPLPAGTQPPIEADFFQQRTPTNPAPLQPTPLLERRS